MEAAIQTARGLIGSLISVFFSFFLADRCPVGDYRGATEAAFCPELLDRESRRQGDNLNAAIKQRERALF